MCARCRLDCISLSLLVVVSFVGSGMVLKHVVSVFCVTGLQREIVRACLLLLTSSLLLLLSLYKGKNYRTSQSSSIPRLPSPPKENIRSNSKIDK
jgi:hypothetical protein